MENTEPDRSDMQIGPAERPDDPLAAWHAALRGPLKALPKRPERTRKQPATPSPDQEGCYFLG